MDNLQKIVPPQSVRGTKSFLVLSLLIGIAVFLYFQRGPLYAQMDEWKLIPRPERFTELYLKNHTSLPKVVIPGQAVPFSFAIHNLEGRTMKYSYEVYTLTLDDYERKVIATDSLLLDDGEEKIIESSVTLPENKERMTVYVTLPELSQEIHFILSR